VYLLHYYFKKLSPEQPPMRKAAMKKKTAQDKLGLVNDGEAPNIPLLESLQVDNFVQI
jgi:hypothetical protein